MDSGRAPARGARVGMRHPVAIEVGDNARERNAGSVVLMDPENDSGLRTMNVRGWHHNSRVRTRGRQRVDQDGDARKRDVKNPYGRGLASSGQGHGPHRATTRQRNRLPSSTGQETMTQSMQADWVVHSDPNISGGTPVLRGTRVPVQSLFDYLEGGERPSARSSSNSRRCRRNRRARRSVWRATTLLPVRVLLDENLPHAPAAKLTGHEVSSVQAEGWAGTDPSSLGLRILIIRAPSNRMADLQPLVDNILTRLAAMRPGQLEVVQSPRGKSGNQAKEQRTLRAVPEGQRAAGARYNDEGMGRRGARRAPRDPHASLGR